MANFDRNDRFGNAGRSRMEGNNDRGYSGDRGGQNRGNRSGYMQGDRENWQTDDVGYGSSGSSMGDGRANPDYFEDRERSFARQTGYGYAGQGDNRVSDNRGPDHRGSGGRDFMDRATDEVASWFGDEDAERRRRMDQHRGKGPKGYVRTDERIIEDVNDRLSEDPMLDASDIEVSVAACEVTLNGLVSNRQDKRRAEDIVDGISGVTHVQNNLRVRPNDQVVNIVS